MCQLPELRCRPAMLSPQQLSQGLVDERVEADGLGRLLLGLEQGVHGGASMRCWA